MTALLDEAREIEEWIIDLRRQLHRRPELGFDLHETAALVGKTLDELGVTHQRGVAQTGIVATIGSGGPCVALRADMDALPIVEEADVAFRSEIEGAMHACGHDCHTAMLLGAARLLKARESTLGGTVKLVFQPAEEGGGGGKVMCDEGALNNPDVQRMFGLHVWPYIDSGTIGSKAGVFLAAAGEFDMTVRGVGGHGAMPDLSVDPIPVAAKIINDLQTLVSREWDPLDSAVVSVCAINAGHAHNVIPETVQMLGTVRAMSLEGLQRLQQRVREIAELTASAHRCTAEISAHAAPYPPTINDAALWQRTQERAGAMLGSNGVLELKTTMGAEDFAFYANEVPSMFVGLGCRNESIGAIYGVHHPRFKMDESVLAIGTALHVDFVLDNLQQLA
ncbi:amidohydrolase [Gammaproteobacteria bacterium]|nr:amidohydrolase [Gammaproteobacteria bacterium]